MKLYEALELGIPMIAPSPQGQSIFNNGHVACALGTIYTGLTGRTEGGYGVETIEDDFPVLNDSACAVSDLPCEEGDSEYLEESLWEAIDRMYERQRMSREEIVAWLKENDL